MKDMDLVKQLGEELAPQKHEPITPLPAAAFRDLPPGLLGRGRPERWP